MFVSLLIRILERVDSEAVILRPQSRHLRGNVTEYLPSFFVSQINVTAFHLLQLFTLINTEQKCPHLQ